jgi:hypothetical protein
MTAAVELPDAAATGIGSLPGTDIKEAVRVVLGEVPELPYLPELPARGPGADMIGRGAGFLVELPVELYAARWQVAGRPGHDARRTADLIERDLDALTDLADGYAGPLKVQAAGPWTLAASLQLPIGGPLLSDPGAVRDLAGSLGEGLAAHVREVSRRVPGAQVILQLDEPSLPAVLAARIPTESGLRTLRAVAVPTATEVLAQVITAAAVPAIVHCCAPDVPIGLLRDAGAAGLALDLTALRAAVAAPVRAAAGAASGPLSGAGRAAELDALGEAIEASVWLFAGVAPSTAATPSSVEIAATVRDVWSALGFPLSRLAGQVVVTPTCGQAGATVAEAVATLRACREAARRLADDALG